MLLQNMLLLNPYGVSNVPATFGNVSGSHFRKFPVGAQRSLRWLRNYWNAEFGQNISNCLAL